MSIAANNDRLTVIIPKSLKSELKILADRENRSVSNYVVNLLENHVEKNRIIRDTNKRNRDADMLVIDINMDEK